MAKKAEPGTIRADFADSIDANAVHGSDAAETAAVEVAFFFPGLNIYSRWRASRAVWHGCMTGHDDQSSRFRPRRTCRLLRGAREKRFRAT